MPSPPASRRRPEPARTAAAVRAVPFEPAVPDWGGPLQAAKVLMVLGLLKRGPRHGYELHQVVVAHGSIYADLKKPTLYHLLERLARAGLVALHTEPGARGPRGERLVYSITGSGEGEFLRLLETMVCHYSPMHMAIEMAVSFLPHVPLASATAWLEARRLDITRYRQDVAAQMAAIPRRGLFATLSGEHLLALADAELVWVDRALTTLAGVPTGAPAGADEH